MKEKKIEEGVKRKYGQIAKQDQQSCCRGCACGVSPLCQTEAIQYSRGELEQIPEGAIMGLGCGNPTAIANLKEGEIVLDLGSGAGVDVFLAANKVGPSGNVIGVDMTEEMIDRAEGIAKNYGYHNVEFRLGEIEKLPVEDKSIDVVISNCVINLTPDKSKAFQEAYRVLKPGAKLVVSDIVTERELPEEIRQNMDAWSRCIAGALEKQDYLDRVTQSGFENVVIASEQEFYLQDEENNPPENMLSITIIAHKPRKTK